MAQERLGNIGSNGTDGNSHLEDIARAATTRAAQDKHGFTWQDKVVTQYGLNTRTLTSEVTHSEAKTGAAPMEVAWVEGDSDALVEYVRQYGDKLLNVPSTYGDIQEQFDEYLGMMTLAGEGKGYGITPGALEQGIRVLSGGGRYRAQQYQAIACGDKPWILSSGKGTLLCGLRGLSSAPEDPPTTSLAITADTTAPAVEVDGSLAVTVPETDERVLAGIRRLFACLSPEEVDYDSIRGTKSEPAHGFTAQTDDGESTRKITGDTLIRIGASLTDTDELAREIASLTADADGISVDPSHLQPGDWPENDEVVVGYEPSRLNTESVHRRQVGYNVLIIKGSYGGMRTKTQFVPVMTLD